MKIRLKVGDQAITAALIDSETTRDFVSLRGETGSGKTTQLPKICLALGRGARGLIGHTQPRRIAARSVAARIAHELGTELLPLTLTMNDLFGREKFGHLPRAISEGGNRTRTYAVGEVVYWSPGPDVAIFYRHDGSSIPSPGIIVMAKVDSGVAALNAPGSVKVTIELVK